MLIQLSAATSEPVSVDEAKAHLRLTNDSDDALIARQISAAREYVERETGRALAAATYQYAGDAFNSPVALPLWPVDGISEVSYLDSGDVRLVIDPAGYTLDSSRSLLRAVDAWPWGQAVNVTFATAPGFIPEGLKSAILARVQAEYEADPDEAQKLRTAAFHLAHPWRRNLGV